MQDVPGAFPVPDSTEQDDDEEEEQTTHLTLSQAVHARRAEYVRPKHVRIKIGTWNVAACKGTEKDVGGWFVEGKGVTKALSGLSVDKHNEVHVKDLPDPSEFEEAEDVAAQEARYERKQPTLPKGDPGSLPGNDDVGLYVLGLQEVVDVNSPSEALRPYTDPSVAKKWKDSMNVALPEHYQLLAEQQLIGLLLLIYASPDVAPEVRSVSTTSVGTGLGGFMGNKGAVTARIVLGETTRLVFVDSHLSAGADKASLERRNWDAAQIVQRTRFESIQDPVDLVQTTGEQIGDEDLAFWVGDLNYRLEGIPGDDVRRLLMLHTRNQYDLSQRSARKIDQEVEMATESVKRRVEHRQSVSSNGSGSTASPPSSEDTRASTDSTAPSMLVDDISASEDPASLQTTLSSLLPHDELQQQMKFRKAFHDGWREGPITFLPTYKYDVGSVGVFDSSDKKRAPSWCDRILYRTRRDKLAYDSKIRREELAKKKDEQMKASGTDRAGDDEEILYDYDPETDGTNAIDEYDEHDEHDDAEDGVVITKEGFEDAIQLEYYTAHQRVLSSDHKPLNAVFMLKYDAVVPELKAKVQAEVAKGLDKAENEGRPNVTVVVDQHNDTQAKISEDDGKTFEGVWFGEVRWGQLKHRSLTIANTSRVTASFVFIERPVGVGQVAGVAPPWLKLKVDGTDVDSSTTATVPVFIEPGDTVPVELEMRIFHMSLVHALNEGVNALDDILVLRVEGGRDHFIPVRAKWLDTSLGRSIDKLIRIPEGGIRRLQNQRPDSSQSRGNSKSRDGSRGSSPGLVNEEPVRFSAPRELFRLTEAVEELATRNIAEWDMISSDENSENAPWIQHAGWPFEEQCWTERTTELWEDATGEACNALDTDEPLETSLPQELPRMQRLYVLASFLLIFLKHVPDGVINEELWMKLDPYLAEVEKAKRKPKNGELRTGIQEILSHAPSHSISFILVTSMLDRISLEIASTSKAKDEPTMSPASKKAAITLRRMTGSLGKVPAAPHQEQTGAAWARIFAGVLFRTATPGNKKGSAPQERRKMEVLEIFLKKDEPG